MSRLSLRSLWSRLSGLPRSDAEAGSRPGRHVHPRELAATESLRERMLALASEAEGLRGRRLQHEISEACDLQALWFLRSNLASALAGREGEDRAMRRIEAASAPARALLPRSLAGAAGRPSLH